MGDDLHLPFVRKGFTRIEVLLALVAMCLGAALFVPWGPPQRVAERRAACLANLGQIGQALQKYLQDSGDVWPSVAKIASAREGAGWPTLPSVLKPYLETSSPAYRCPADRRHLSKGDALYPKFGGRTTYYETEGLSYEWWFGEAYGGRKVGEESLRKAGGFGMGRADQPLLTDFEPFHVGDEQGAMNTLNADLKPRTSRAKSKM